MWPSAEDFTGVTRPEEITYIHMLRIYLNFLGGWPASQTEDAELKINVYKRSIIMFFYIMCAVSEIEYLNLNAGRKTFIVLGHSYITTLMHIVGVIRFVFVQTKYFHKTTRRFIQSIHLYNHRNKSVHYMKIHLLVHKVSHFFSVVLLSMMFMGIFFFNMSPLYINISSGAFASPRPTNVTFEHAVYHALPFDYITDLKGYFIIFIFNWWLSFLISITFCAIDLLVYLMVFHLCGHLKILIHDLECFPRPAYRSISSSSFVEPLTFSHQEMNKVQGKLIKSIVHHKLIVSFATEMFGSFGWMLAVNYCFHQVVGCLLLLECSQMDLHTLTRYGPLTFLVFQQLIQLSFIFEVLGSTSDKLSEAVYNLPWECMDQNNKKLVLTFLRQSQKSLYLKAVDMVTVGVQTMAAILKTSMSYFLMLHTVAKNES